MNKDSVVCMKKTLVFLIILSTLFSQAAPAQKGLDYSFQPSIYKSFGKTSYLMDISGFDENSQFLRLKSELIFPVDLLMIGGRAGITRYINNRDDWSVQIGLNINANSKTGPFEDYDWFTGDAGAGFFNDKFSSMTSDVKANQLEFTLELKKLFYYSPQTMLYFWVGYRYQRINQTAINILKGSWQIDYENDSSFTPDTLDFNYITEGLKYRINYNTPFLGLIFKRQPYKTLTLEFKAAYLILSVSDFDDHILRGKKSTASGSGKGFWGGIDIKYTPRQYFKDRKFYIGLKAELIYKYADTRQTQEWYMDEGDIEAGYIIGDIPHEIETTQYRLGIEAGFKF
jgi:hypothetical protein